MSLPTPQRNGPQGTLSSQLSANHQAKPRVVCRGNRKRSSRRCTDDDNTTPSKWYVGSSLHMLVKRRPRWKSPSRL